MPKEIKRKRGRPKKIIVPQEDQKTISQPLEPKQTTTTLIKSSLKLLGKIYFAEGQTIQEAISNLKPDRGKGIGILTLEKGELKKEKIIPYNLIYRLFGNVSRFNKEIALKQVANLFDKNLYGTSS